MRASQNTCFQDDHLSLLTALGLIAGCQSYVTIQSHGEIEFCELTCFYKLLLASEVRESLFRHNKSLLESFKVSFQNKDLRFARLFIMRYTYLTCLRCNNVAVFFLIVAILPTTFHSAHRMLYTHP